ncbi:protein phosphatase 1 regulatory subunit 1B-like [Gadus chalcogrammus]|uniref:protein phosphatase 1 regulatory subunit 1B-like n=1 Tax=Gadus chalcogrammus TaxID=1042646 RepID=UPI0024C4A225|nr:protein phosphatase 1 regulatory subunit 1B-like [Gadus chalcogrammus]
MFVSESISTQRACAGHPRVRTGLDATSMDAVLPTEAELTEPGPGKERRRRTIQFTVPPPSSAPAQLDSRQVEMIRRRRPTPATLFTLSDPASPEEGAVSLKGALKASRNTPSGYEPPSLKDVQRMAQAHLESWASVEKEDGSSSDGEPEEISKDMRTLHFLPTTALRHPNAARHHGDQGGSADGGEDEED